MPLKYIAAFLTKTEKACCDYISSYSGVGRNVGGSRIHVYPSFLSKLQVFYRATAEFTNDFDLKNDPAIEKVIIQRLF